MKCSFLYLFAALLLIANSAENPQRFLLLEEEKTFDPDTKYFIYNTVTGKCLKRELKNNGYTNYNTTTIGNCTDDDDSLWYIRKNHIISAATNYCLAIVNNNNLGSKDCDKSVITAVYHQDFVIDDGTICTKAKNCLKDKNGKVGDIKNKNDYYKWTISTSLPK